MSVVGEIVQTPYGPGRVIEEKEDHYMIQPTNWEMACGQKPSFYIRKSDVKQFYNIGDIVRTIYGTGIIQSIREDGTHVVAVESWKLANNTSPILYLQANALKKEIVNGGRRVGDLVQTMYGKGKIVEIRSSGVIVVSPTNWLLANGKPPVFYLNANDQSLVTLKEPQVTIEAESVTSPTPETKPAEQSTIWIRINRAIELKDQGTEFFQKNDFENAASLYGQALTVMNYLGTDLTNDEKAAVFEQTVPCHNNMALCCIKRGKHREAAEFSKASVELIESLEQRFSTSLVWVSLQARGVTLDTLLKKWKRRALIYLGKAYVALLEFKLARNCFKSALQLIQSDPSLVKESNEIQQLIVTTSKKLDKQTKKEKNIWSKALQKQSSEDLNLTPPPTPLSQQESTKSSQDASELLDQDQNQDQEEDIDLSEFGLGPKKTNKKNSTGGQLVMNTPTQYLLFSVFSLGIIGALVAFGRFRNFKWRF